MINNSNFNIRDLILLDVDSMSIEEKEEYDRIKNWCIGMIEKYRKNNNYPNLDFFIKNTQAGEEAEKFITENIFTDIYYDNHKYYDRQHEDERIEIKSIRMLSNEGKGVKEIYQRSLSIFDEQKNISNNSFQQVKPNTFDYLIGILIYKDGFKLYKIPSEDFYPTVVKKRDSENEKLISKLNKNNKIILSAQHKDSLNEGQIRYSILEKYLKISIYIDNDNNYYLIDENGKKTNELFNKISFTDI